MEYPNSENSEGDKELEKFLDFLIRSLPPAAADFFGVKMHKVKLSIPKKRKLLLEMKIILSGFRTLETIKPPFATRSEWIAALDTFDRAMKPLLDPPFRKTHVADYLRQSYLSLIDAPLEARYFSQTNYQGCCKEIDSIAFSLFNTQRQALADKLFYEVGESPDSGILGQALLVHMPRITDYLARSKGNFQRSDIDRLVRTYSQLCSYYEKSLRMVVGMLEALEGKEPAYSVISKRKLSANLNLVKKAHPILTGDFDITVRNSIAHGSHYFHYNAQTIDFHDLNGKKVTWSFLELVKQCRRLSALAMSCMMSYFVFQARRWQNTWDAYCSEKGKS